MDLGSLFSSNSINSRNSKALIHCVSGYPNERRARVREMDDVLDCLRIVLVCRDASRCFHIILVPILLSTENRIRDMAAESVDEGRLDIV